MTKAAKKFQATQAEIDAAQRIVGFLMPYQTKRLLTTDETAQCLGREVCFARELVEKGKLEAHQDSAFGSRKSNRITRRSVLVHLLRTANYGDEWLIDEVIEIAMTFSRPARERLVRAIEVRNRMHP